MGASRWFRIHGGAACRRLRSLGPLSIAREHTFELGVTAEAICTVTRPLIIFQISCRISCWDVSPTNRSFPERLISAGARSPTAAICIGSLLTCHSATGPFVDLADLDLRASLVSNF